MAQEMRINFKCPICGGTQLNIADMNNDMSPVSCASCGSEFGLWGDIKANLGITGEAAAPAEKPKFKGLSSTFKTTR